jgi:hypothetical protein
MIGIQAGAVSFLDDGQSHIDTRSSQATTCPANLFPIKNDTRPSEAALFRVWRMGHSGSGQSQSIKIRRRFPPMLLCSAVVVFAQS